MARLRRNVARCIHRELAISRDTERQSAETNLLTENHQRPRRLMRRLRVALWRGAHFAAAAGAAVAVPKADVVGVPNPGAAGKSDDVSLDKSQEQH